MDIRWFRLFLFGISLSVLFCLQVSGQTGSWELGVLNDSWSLTGTWSAHLGKVSRFGFSSVNRFSAGYQDIREHKFLSMNYLSMSWSDHWKGTAGIIWMKQVECKPSIGCQYLVNGQRFQCMIFPNLNIGKTMDMMVLSMVQYSFSNQLNTGWFVRSQHLSWLTQKNHLFTTFRLRLGKVRGKWQYGAAGNFDLSGKDYCFASSYGLFCQKVF